MKWKDSEDTVDGEREAPKGDYFDEEQFSPWSEPKDSQKKFKFGKIPLLIFLLIICIIASLTILVMLLMGGNGDSATRHQLAVMEERLRQMEGRLDEYKVIDEKVTRIWEQAKSFEKFQDRFNRSEASTSLRMDHLTMSLEALQKQVKEMVEKPAPVKAAKPENTGAPEKPAITLQYHQVAGGDTLYSISKRYNLSVAKLLELNHLDKNSVILPGQKLIVSGEGGN
jgi:hypothetical protein